MELKMSQNKWNPYKECWETEEGRHQQGWGPRQRKKTYEYSKQGFSSTLSIEEKPDIYDKFVKIYYPKSEPARRGFFKSQGLVEIICPGDPDWYNLVKDNIIIKLKDEIKNNQVLRELIRDGYR